MGLPQMKAYFDINVYFHFRTLEPNGLLMYNAGKDSDFLALELVGGHIHYVVDLGSGPVSLRDAAPSALNDNKWHSVAVGRQHQGGQGGQHTLLVDDRHLSKASSVGREMHLDLDGILFLGK